MCHHAVLGRFSFDSVSVWPTTFHCRDAAWCCSPFWVLRPIAHPYASCGKDVSCVTAARCSTSCVCFLMVVVSGVWCHVHEFVVVLAQVALSTPTHHLPCKHTHTHIVSFCGVLVRPSCVCVCVCVSACVGVLGFADGCGACATVIMAFLLLGGGVAFYWCVGPCSIMVAFVTGFVCVCARAFVCVVCACQPAMRFIVCHVLLCACVCVCVVCLNDVGVVGVAQHVGAL